MNPLQLTWREQMAVKGLRLTLLGGLLLASALQAAPAASVDLRIEHVSIVSPERPGELPDATVTVRDGRIASIGAGEAGQGAARRSGERVLDGRGLYLAPGLIDSHVHLNSIAGMTDEQERAHPDIAQAARRQIPRSYLYFGFTTLIDLISAPQAMARWKSNDPVPDTYFCGGAAMMDGYPMNYFPKEVRYSFWPYMLIEPKPGQVVPPGIDPTEHTPQAVVQRMKADGAICVKTFFERGFGGVHDLPVPQLDTVRALVRAAHAAGLPVFIHANSAEAQRFGLDAGVDILAHGLWNVDKDAANPKLTPEVKAILERVIATHTGWQPTLQVLPGIQDLFNPAFLSDPMLTHAVPRSLIDWYKSPEGQWQHDLIAADIGHGTLNLSVPMARVAAATGYLARRGARLLFGTDTPSAPTYANPPGLNGWMEMHRLVAAGMTPAQIFEAATWRNARAVKLDREIGTVEVGKRANLLLLRGDPRESIEAYDGIVDVILDGRVLERSALAADHAP